MFILFLLFCLLHFVSESLKTLVDSVSPLQKGRREQPLIQCFPFLSIVNNN